MTDKSKLIFFIICSTCFFALSAPAYASWLLDSDGKLVAPWDFVLGSKTSNEKSNSNAKETKTEQTVSESKATVKPKATVKNAKNTEKIQIQVREKTASESMKYAVKAEIKPSGDSVKVKLTDRSGNVVIDDATPSGDFVIEESKDKNQIKIKSHENASVVIKDKMAAKTKFPLMVNLETNELIVTTPHGTKVVTVLPDAAVRHMLAANVLDQLGGKGGLLWLADQERIRNATGSARPVATSSATPLATATGSARPTSTALASLSPVSTASPSVEPTTSPEATVVPTNSPDPAVQVDATVELVENKTGDLVYRISGTKNKKLFGISPVVLQRTVVVSAETGEIMTIEQSFGTKILDLLSR